LGTFSNNSRVIHLPPQIYQPLSPDDAWQINVNEEGALVFDALAEYDPAN